ACYEWVRSTARVQRATYCCRWRRSECCRSCRCRRRCRCGCRCRRKCSCGCRRKRGRRCKCRRRRTRRRRRRNVAVNERGAFQCAAGDVIEEGGNIVRAIELHQSGALAGLARNQDVATQACEGDRKILVESYLPL